MEFKLYYKNNLNYTLKVGEKREEFMFRFIAIAQ